MYIKLTKSDIQWCEKLVQNIASKNPKSRKQSKLSEYQISIEGARAELAAARFLCKNIIQYKKKAMELKSNRGKDLLKEITGLPKNIEIKFTPIKDETRGCLFLRPPFRTGLVFDRHNHIDDSIFFLVFSPRDDLKKFEMLGWIDSGLLFKIGRYNPIPRNPGQFETFGVHWSQLLPPDMLIS